MDTMRFMLNDGIVTPRTGPGTPLIDYLRKERGLPGTKEGCREGDCGACAVLVGERLHASERLRSGELSYRAMPSCLLATGELAGKHLVTIEGLVSGSPGGMTPVMQAFVDANASQCGFCSPGFVISLTAWLAGTGPLDASGAMAAVDGNLCRCTGYGSIRRAAEKLAKDFAFLPGEPEPRLKALVEAGVLPRSVLVFASEGVPESTTGSVPGIQNLAVSDGRVFLGGGTDYFVRNPDPAEDFSPVLLRRAGGLSGIRAITADSGRWIEVGASTSVTDFFESGLLEETYPGLGAYKGKFASTLVRNLATVGGNIANASPVGDLTSLLLGLGVVLELRSAGVGSPRLVALENFFLGYKNTDLRADEFIAALRIPADPDPARRFSFEKISKRVNLDIASVNSTLSFTVREGKFFRVRLSAGGVAPVPMLLARAAGILEGAAVPGGRDAATGLAELARRVAAAAEAEVKPISDVRGSADYRRRITGRLVLAHFLRIFGKEDIGEVLFP